METAEFNEHGVCINHEIIAVFGNDRIYYRVKAALYKNRVITSADGRGSIEGFGFPLTKKDLDFTNSDEAIAFHKKRAEKWAETLPDKDRKIMISALEKHNLQLELF